MVDEKTGIEFVAIPAGTFLMGSRNDDGEREEHPQHRVTVSAFELGKYAVTNEQYRHFLDESPNLSKPPGSSGSSLGPRQPVVNVTWEDAQAFAHWAGFRLPTEAEREYAARAGTQTRYFSGDDEADLARVGWFLGNSEAHSHDVGEKAGNGLGLYDMHGNVWEWCSDWYAAYDGKAAVDPTGPEKGNARVVRGGSWGDAAQYARSASRYGDPAAYHSDTVGFRLARGPRSGK